MTAGNSRLWLLLALLAGCKEPTADASAPPPGPPPGPSCVGPAVTVLGGEVYGSVQRRITATVANTVCRGMPRPDGNGARLQFVYQPADGAGDDTELTVILGIDGLARLGTGQGLRTTVTLVDRAGARIFSSADGDNCHSDVSAHEAGDSDGLTLVTGVAYCTVAIPEVNGDGNVRLSELRFSGHIRWPAAPPGDAA
jgi:hypothetical protein